VVLVFVADLELEMAFFRFSLDLEVTFLFTLALTNNSSFFLDLKFLSLGLIFIASDLPLTLVIIRVIRVRRRGIFLLIFSCGCLIGCLFLSKAGFFCSGGFFVSDALGFCGLFVSYALGFCGLLVSDALGLCSLLVSGALGFCGSLFFSDSSFLSGGFFVSDALGFCGLFVSYALGFCGLLVSDALGLRSLLVSDSLCLSFCGLSCKFFLFFLSFFESFLVIFGYVLNLPLHGGLIFWVNGFVGPCKTVTSFIVVLGFSDIPVFFVKSTLDTVEFSMVNDFEFITSVIFVVIIRVIHENMASCRI
jgi:hypothetical protein